MVLTEELEARIRELSPEEHIHIIVKTKKFKREHLGAVSAKPFHSIRHCLKIVQAFSLALPVGKVSELAISPWVERVERDKKVYATLDTSLPLIGVPSVWESGLKGKGIKIALIDTGIDKNHPDIKDRMIGTSDFTLEGFRDLNGHGSHVAGIAAGNGSASQGKFKGVAPEALILAAKALKSDGSGRMSDVMAAIEWAIEREAQVINLSLGSEGPCDGSDTLSETCDAAVSQGVVVVVAAGNEGPKKRSIGSPGCARGVITVGASSDKDEVADFSSHGPTLDERLKPELVAPGVDIVSARAQGVSMGKPVNQFYTSATGTSMSTPHITGLAALFLEAKPEASPLLIKEALVNTAKDLKVNEWAQGAGRVRAEEALKYVHSHENPAELPDLESKPGCLTTFLEIGYLIRQKLKRRE